MSVDRDPGSSTYNTEVRLALLEQQLAFEKEARNTQALEYERRLGELNHAHAEAIRVQHTYVAEDIYDRDHRELAGRLEKLEKAGSEQRGQYAVLALGVTVGLSILTVVVNVALKLLVP